MNAPFTIEPARKAPESKPEWALTRREKKKLVRIAAGKKPSRLPLILTGVLVLAAVGYGGYAGYERYTTPPPQVVTAPEPIMQLNRQEIETVAPGRLEERVKVTGTIAPGAQAQLSAQVSGQIESVEVRPGDRVTRGQTLVQIDVESLRIQLNQQRSTAEATRAQLAQAEKQLERTQSLFDRNLATAATLDQMQTNVDALRANLRALEAQVTSAEIALGKATVVAPWDGAIAARSVEPGQLVAVGTSMLTIVDLSTVEFRASAAVSAAAQLAPGQAVAVKVDGLGGREFAGVAQRINPIAQEGTRTIPVYVSIDNPDGLLRGGMFATGGVIVDALDDAIGIKATALRSDAEGDFVLKIAGERLARQPVEKGRAWDGGRVIGIKSGLEAGDVVVTAPLSQLKAGDKIQIAEK